MGLNQVLDAGHALHFSRECDQLGGPLLGDLLDALVVGSIDEHNLGLGHLVEALDNGRFPRVVDGVEGRGLEEAGGGHGNHKGAGVGDDADAVILGQALALEEQGNPGGIGQHVGVGQNGAIVVGDLLLYNRAHQTPKFLGSRGYAIVYLNHIGGPAAQRAEDDLTYRCVLGIHRGPRRAAPDLRLLVEEGRENSLGRHFASPILIRY